MKFTKQQEKQCFCGWSENQTQIITESTGSCTACQTPNLTTKAVGRRSPVNTFLRAVPVTATNHPGSKKWPIFPQKPGGNFLILIVDAWGLGNYVLEIWSLWFQKHSKPPKIICLVLKPYKIRLYAFTFLELNLPDDNFVFENKLGSKLNICSRGFPTEMFLCLQACFLTAWL